MRQANYGSEPEFDEELIEEYRKASAEQFAAPKSRSLRQPPKEKPFRWPGLDQRRDTIALDRDALSKVVNKDPAELDDTVISKSNRRAESTAVKWVLDIGGRALYLLPSANVVVGRKPQSVEGGDTMSVNDPGRTLSKSHARLFFKNDAWHVQDLGSTNGTAVHSLDGVGLAENKLEPGESCRVEDSFRLGTLKVQIRKLIG